MRVLLPERVVEVEYDGWRFRGRGSRGLGVEFWQQLFCTDYHLMLSNREYRTRAIYCIFMTLP